MAILRNDTTVRSADGQTTSAIITAANIGNYGISTTSTYFIGTTQNVFNRASGAQTLTGVSIDGNAATVTNGVYTTGAQTIGGTKTFSDGVVVNGATYYTFNKPTTTNYQTVALFGSASGGLFLTTDSAIIGVGAYYNAGWIATATSGRQIDFAGGTFNFNVFSGATVGGAANWGSVATLNSSGTFSATGDFRAPVFYDSNNTTYYLDPNASTSGNLFGVLKQNDGKFVRDSYFRTISGTGDYYASGASGWYTVASITLTTNCTGGVLYGTLYDNRYDGADTYQIAIVARAECDFTTNNESHYVNVGCTILGSTGITNYQSKIRVLLVASSANSRTYEVQFFETSWNRDTWQLETGGSPVWTIYSTAQAPGTSTGTARVFYISNKNADNIRANTASYSPIYYDSNDTSYYLDAAGTSRLNTTRIGNINVGSGTYLNTITPIGDTNINLSSPSGAFYFDTFPRMPGFYDSGDTTYYLDPANTGTALAIAGNAGVGTASPTLSSGKGIHINSSSGHANLKLQSSGRTWELLSTTGAYFSVYDTTGGADRLTVTSGGNVGVATTAADTNLQVVGHVHVGNQTTFDNTGGWNKTIYLDGTVHARMRIIGSAFASGKNSQTETNIWVDNSVAPYSGLTTNAGSFTINAGFTTLTNSARSPIFYDSDNTAFYVDPASTSVLNALTVGGNNVLTTASTLTAGNLSGTIPSAVLGNSTVNIGTTAIALNRGSGSQTLTGVSIDGNAANVTGTVAIANGGTGNTTAQAAINALAGAVTSGQYLRGNGTNVVMSAIQAADVPTLNQNTTGNAATASLATTSDRLTTRDNRTISPSEDDAFRLRYGFTSWANNDSSPYADYLHLRSYSDASGGNDNLVMFRKDAIGMRIWQQTFGSATAYATFKDVAFTDQSFFIGTTSVAINRSSASQTLTGVSIDGNSGTATILQTARNINGTSFNGSAAITTATWGTSRTITIGSTGKSVDGSAGVSWSLAEIGAAATNQTMFIGTTSVAINRASASQTLTGVSIDGNAATASNATQFGGEANTNFMRGLAGGTEANINNYTDNGFRTVAYTGHGKGLLSFNVGSSIGTVQHEYFYNIPTNGWRVRNKTDNTTWSSWGNIVMTDTNQGALTGTVITTGNSSGLSPTFSNLYAAVFYDAADSTYYLDPANTTTSLKTRSSIIINNASAPQNLAMLNIGYNGAGETRAIDIYGSWSGGENKSITFNHASTTSDIVAQINAQHNGPASRLRWGKLYHGGNSSTYTMELISESTTSAYLTVAGSVRAPIFYDSNDTTYYLDPAAATSLNIAGQITTAKTNGTLLSIAGADTIGYNATAGRGAYIKGTGGTYVYGSGVYYDGSSVRQMLYEDTWLNSKYFDSNGIIYSQTSMRAPIFYDYNDTNYYIDPASTSVLNRLKVDGGNFVNDYFQSISDFASGTLVTTDIDASVASGESFVMNVVGKSYSASASPFNFSVQGYLYNSTIINYSGLSLDSTGLSTIKIFNNGGFLCFWWARVSYWNAFEVSVRAYNSTKANYNRVTNVTDSTEPVGSKKVTVTLQSFLRADVSATNSVDLRAPIFYDSNDTTYYTDPSSLSNILELKTNKNWYDNSASAWGGGINMGGNNPSIGFQSTASTWWYMLHHSSSAINFYRRSTSGSWNQDGIWDSSGNLIWQGSSVRGQIFYDNNNTSYYVDPASTSNLVGLTVANTITGSISGNAATATNVTWTGITQSTRTNYDLAFQPPSSGYAGFSFKTSAGGEAGYFLVRGTSDTDVYTAEGITLVADGGWLTLAQRTTASRGVRIMTGTTSSERLKITTAGDIQFVNGNSITYNGNVVLHAGNYGGYSTFSGSISSGGNITATGYIYTSTYLQTGGNLIYPSGYGATQRLEVSNSANNTWIDGITIAPGGIVTAPYEMRSPIFYDSNNTAFYIDAASTSNLNVLNIAEGNLELYKSQTVDMSNTTTYSTSNYYPVTIPVPTEGCIIQIQNNLNSNVPSWATHGGGFTLNLKWRTNGFGWGTTQVRRIIDQYYELFTNQTICGGITQMGNSSTEVVWLRGGGQYYFKFSRNLSATAQSATYTVSSQSVSPTSTAQNTIWNSATGASIQYNEQTISTTNMYTPVLYDWNNSAYYVDPASTSNLNAITAAGNITAAQYYTGGWFRNSVSGNGLYNESTTQHFYSDDVSYWNVASSSSAQGIRFRTGGHGGTVRGYVYANDSNDVGFLNSGGNWRARIVGGDYLLADGSSIRGQLFYDSNNTSYYIDPASTSNLVGLTVANTISGSINGTANGLNSSNYISRVGSSGNYNTDFQNTPAGTVRHLGDDASATNNPGGTWWFVDNYRHSNGSNYWGTQVAWGWEDQANKLATRNITGGTFGSWVYYLNSGNYSNYAIARGGDTVDGVIYFRSNKGSTSTVGANNSYSLEAYSSDAGAAGMSFHRGGYYAVNMGLDPDNVFRIGGWSASANRLQLDMSGNLTLAGVVDATQFRDSSNTAYYIDPASQSKLYNLLIETGTANTSMTIVGSNQPSIFLKTTDNARNIEIFNSYGNFGIYRSNAPSNYIIYHVDNGASSSTEMQLQGAARLTINSNGLTAATSVRSPIFYDSDNTGYYIDAASTSILNLVRTRNTFGERIAVTSAASTTIDTNFNVTELTMSASITTLTLSNIQASTIVHMWTIVTVGNGTAYSITWPAAIKWPGGTAPTITSTNAKRDIYQFVTYDGGTNIYAIIVGQNL